MKSDPRTRFFIFIVLFMLVVSAGSFFDFAILSLVLITGLLAGGGSLNRLFLRMTALGWIIVMAAYFGIVSPASEPGAWALTLTAVWRLMLLVVLALGAASWFSPNDLITVMASLHRKPGRLAGFLSRISLAVGLTFRMLPEIMIETRRVYLVAKIRGLFAPRFARLNPTPWLGVLAPALRRTMVRARRTGFALVVRGFNPDRTRTSAVTLNFGRIDFILLLSLSALTVIILIP
ncbi:energy-coupling factor transporter transmembrane component T family protein [candidate division KSB1 bacterium]